MDQSAAVPLDLHRLELRYAALRLRDAPAITRLAQSIAVNGQLVPCIANRSGLHLGGLRRNPRKFCHSRSSPVESGDLHEMDGQVGYTELGYLLKVWPRTKKPM